MWHRRRFPHYALRQSARFPRVWPASLRSIDTRLSEPAKQNRDSSTNQAADHVRALRHSILARQGSLLRTVLIQGPMRTVPSLTPALPRRLSSHASSKFIEMKNEMPTVAAAIRVPRGSPPSARRSRDTPRRYRPSASRREQPNSRSTLRVSASSPRLPSFRISDRLKHYRPESRSDSEASRRDNSQRPELDAAILSPPLPPSIRCTDEPPRTCRSVIEGDFIVIDDSAAETGRT